MKLSLFEKFNRPETLLVISSYPEKGIKYSGQVCAVGGFAKNTLLSLKKLFKKEGSSRKIVVLTLAVNGPQIYQENGILVVRCLERNKPLSYLKLLANLRKLGKAKKILVEFEFASFGGIVMNLILLGVLGWLSLTGKEITLVLHQVIFNLKEIWGHLGLGKRSLRIYWLEKFLKIYYQCLCGTARKIIVLEDEFKKRLSASVNEKKIIMIPHGVDTQMKIIDKKRARKLLGFSLHQKIALFFGYLSWYKGPDWLINHWPRSSNWRLLIAGGRSFSQQDKPHYQTYLAKLLQQAKTKRIEVTGFLSEEKIPLYLAAADLMILPYRTLMSSSGPLSLALAYAKPFILSRPLSKVLKSADYQAAMAATELKEEEIVFKLTKSSLREHLKTANFKKLKSFAQLMRKKRSFTRLSSKYYAQIYQDKQGYGQIIQPVFNWWSGNVKA